MQIIKQQKNESIRGAIFALEVGEIVEVYGKSTTVRNAATHLTADTGRKFSVRRTNTIGIFNVERTK